MSMSMLLRHQPAKVLFQRCLPYPKIICRTARHASMAHASQYSNLPFTGSGVGYRHPTDDNSSIGTGISSSKASASKRPQLSNFCRKCGGPIAMSIPPGENEERNVCTDCGYVDYYNPKLVVGCIVEHEGQLLLCRRAIEPCKGKWTVPAGFLEMGESSAAGAARETWEEASARVEILAPYAHWDIPAIGQAYILFRARLVRPYTFAPGTESLETRLFAPDEIPFDEIAFSSVATALRLYAFDLKTGRFHIHHGVIEKAKGSAPNDPGTFVLKDHFAIASQAYSMAKIPLQAPYIRKRCLFDWLREHTILDDSAAIHFSGRPDSLYEAYSKYCRMNHQESVSSQALSTWLKQYLFEEHKVRLPRRRRSSRLVILGLRFRDSASPS